MLIRSLAPATAPQIKCKDLCKQVKDAALAEAEQMALAAQTDPATTSKDPIQEAAAESIRDAERKGE